MLANRCFVCRNAPASPPANNFIRSRRTTLSRVTFAAQLCDQASAALGQNLLQLSWDGYPSGAPLAPLPLSELGLGADVGPRFSLACHAGNVVVCVVSVVQ